MSPPEGPDTQEWSGPATVEGHPLFPWLRQVMGKEGYPPIGLDPEGSVPQRREVTLQPERNPAGPDGVLGAIARPNPKGLRVLILVGGETGSEEVPLPGDALEGVARVQDPRQTGGFFGRSLHVRVGQDHGDTRFPGDDPFIPNPILVQLKGKAVDEQGHGYCPAVRVDFGGGGKVR
jgi:hypothetical protein